MSKVILMPAGKSAITNREGQEPAEITTLNCLKKEYGNGFFTKEDICLLFVSDTEEGKKSAEILEQMIREQFGIKIEKYIVPNLQVSNIRKKDFKNVLQEFAGIVASKLKDYRGREFVVIATTGFKIVSSFLTLIGMLHNLRIVYCFENSETLLEMPPMDIRLGVSIFKKYYPLFAALKSSQVEISTFYNMLNTTNIPYELSPFIQPKGGYASLTSLGEILWNQSLAEYRDDRIKILWKRKFIDDCVLPNLLPGKKLVFVAITDIDDFKKVNDKYGHEAGDRVLESIAKVIVNTASQNRSLLKKSVGDSIFFPEVIRWGGEEFMIIGQATQQEGICQFLEKIRKSVEEIKIELESGEIIRKTISIGAAMKELKILKGKPAYSTSEVLNGLWNHADTLLYKAKEDGKNRVKCNILT